MDNKDSMNQNTPWRVSIRALFALIVVGFTVTFQLTSCEKIPDISQELVKALVEKETKKIALVDINDKVQTVFSVDPVLSREQPTQLIKEKAPQSDQVTSSVPDDNFPDVNIPKELEEEVKRLLQGGITNVALINREGLVHEVLALSEDGVVIVCITIPEEPSFRIEDKLSMSLGIKTVHAQGSCGSGCCPSGNCRKSLGSCCPCS
jgi:hypothetical protein